MLLGDPDKRGTHYRAQTDLEQVFLSPQLPECWIIGVCRHTRGHLPQLAGRH